MYYIVIMVNNYIPRFNFVYKLQCFQGYLRRKINVHRVLVYLNLVETSKEYLIFIDLKIPETRCTTIQRPLVTFE